MRSRRCRSSSDALQQIRSHEALPHAHALGPAYAGQGAELCVTALDELPEEGRIQPGLGGVRSRALKLARVTVERRALAFVLIRHVDHEGRRGGVVDEVVADPVRLPG